MAGHHARGARTGTETSEKAGVEGNARLTAVNGIILIVLLFVEGITILQIRGLITLHVFLGLMLVGPVTLKCGSTIYRFARYYGHRPAYVRRGPPALPLRVLGPLVIISTVAVIGTGIGLLAYRPGNAGGLLTAHKASFIVWVALMTIHVLAHLREAAVTSGRELRPRRNDPADRNRASRTLALVGALVIGVGIAAAVTPTAGAWVGYRTHNGR
jgi:hypothetical protein